MKIKNISLSFFVLASLLVLSFAFYVRAENTSAGTKSIFLDSDQDGLSDEEEKIYGTDPHNPDTDGDGYSDGAEVRSGYDPLKKAPGDKLPGFTGTRTTSDPNSAVLGDASQKNLTTDIAQKINDLAVKSTTDNKQVSLDDVQTLVDQTMTPSTISDNDLPEVNEKDIKIKKQNYGNLSADKAKAKKKEDCLDYLSAMAYILTSNSPQPITKIPDATKLFSTLTSTITTAITTQSASGLQDLMTGQKKVVEQLRAVEVPQDLVSIHIKALRFSMYSENLGNLLQSNPEDPMGSIANLSKIQGFITALSDFSIEAESKISEYGLTYDATVQKKLEGFGIDAPKSSDELNSLLNAATTTTSATTDTTTNP